MRGEPSLTRSLARACAPHHCGLHLTCFSAVPFVLRCPCSPDGQTLLGHVKQWQLVTNRTGSGLVNQSSSYYEGAWLSLTYSMVQPDDHVEWDLYTSPDQVNAAPFLQSFAPVFEKLSERTSFTPHYRVVDGSAHGW